jgi:hypothetical protein
MLLPCVRAGVWAITARKRALNQRVAAFGSDVGPALYRERIWPKLRAVKLSAIVDASGYKAYASYIRAGRREAELAENLPL